MKFERVDGVVPEIYERTDRHTRLTQYSACPTGCTLRSNFTTWLYLLLLSKRRLLRTKTTPTAMKTMSRMQADKVTPHATVTTVFPSPALGVLCTASGDVDVDCNQDTVGVAVTDDSCPALDVVEDRNLFSGTSRHVLKNPTRKFQTPKHKTVVMTNSATKESKHRMQQNRFSRMRCWLFVALF